MPGGKGFAVFEGDVQQAAELHGAVAKRAGVGGARQRVGKGKGLHDIGAEILREVGNDKGHAKGGAEAFHGGHGIAAFRSREEAGMEGGDAVASFAQGEQGEEAVGSAADGNGDIHVAILPLCADEGKPLLPRLALAFIFIDISTHEVYHEKIVPLCGPCRRYDAFRLCQYEDRAWPRCFRRFCFFCFSFCDGTGR